MKPIKTAVIGVGHLGKYHARICKEAKNIELVAVVDANRETAREVGDLHQVPCYTDYNEIAEEYDAVHVVVPTDKHYEVTRTLLSAGKHVLLEKPMTSTVSEADELMKLARDNDRVLQVGHVERFNPAVIGIQKVLTKPIFIEVHRLSPFNPRGTEVSVVFDLMIHDLDIILDIVGDKIKRIESTGINVLSNYQDIANVRIVFKKGCVANITASRISKKRVRKFRVFFHNHYMYITVEVQKCESEPCLVKSQ